MLGLATHESRFYVLREEVLSAKHQTARCALCGSEGHTSVFPPIFTCSAEQCTGKPDRPRGALTRESRYMHQHLQILQIPVLREYLSLEFASLARQVSFPFDFENLVDDLVFLCFLVGNDFLPHLPCLEIREGGLNLLLNLYRSLLPSLDGFLTSQGGQVHLPRVMRIFAELARVEGTILKRRRAVQVEMDIRARARAAREGNKDLRLTEKREEKKAAPAGNREEINLEEDGELAALAKEAAAAALGETGETGETKETGETEKKEPELTEEEKKERDQK